MCIKLRKVSATLLLSISILHVLFCTATALGLSPTQGQTLAQQPLMTAITEGYIFSKHSDYGNDDRDYVQGDILYVWAWSSNIDPYNVRDHYCQLKLDEYVHEFYLNYDPNMTHPNSYTGFYNLSRLEKTGEWTVQIFLRTSPPKPISFDETDVIYVSPKAPPTHELSVSSSPISGVTFSLDGTDRRTPFSSFLEEGRYMIVMPSTVDVVGTIYVFVNWSDGSTDSTRIVNLLSDKSITAYFEEEIPPPQTYVLSVGSSPLSGVSFTLDGVNHTTPFAISLEEGSYTIIMPLNVTVAGKVYSFVEWDNGITSPLRSIELTKYTVITAYYVAPIETSNSTVSGKVTDNQGNPITEAKITIVETGEYIYTLSEPPGQYKFENLTPGNYTIRVEADGYITANTSVVIEPNETYTQDFSLTPTTTEPTQRLHIELWQLGAASLAVIGAVALFLLWRSRKGYLKEIKKAEYKNTLEIARLETRLKELDNLLQKGLLSEEKYEILRREAEDELARIRSLKS
jgi:hypothetical protein